MPAVLSDLYFAGKGVCIMVEINGRANSYSISQSSTHCDIPMPSHQEVPDPRSHPRTPSVMTTSPFRTGTSISIQFSLDPHVGIGPATFVTCMPPIPFLLPTTCLPPILMGGISGNGGRLGGGVDGSGPKALGSISHSILYPWFGGSEALAQILTLNLLLPSVLARSARIYAVARPFGAASRALASSVSMSKETPGQVTGLCEGRVAKTSFMMPLVSSLMMRSRPMKRSSAGMSEMEAYRAHMTSDWRLSGGTRRLRASGDRLEPESMYFGERVSEEMMAR